MYINAKSLTITSYSQSSQWHIFSTIGRDIRPALLHSPDILECRVQWNLNNTISLNMFFSRSRPTPYRTNVLFDVDITIIFLLEIG